MASQWQMREPEQHTSVGLPIDPIPALTLLAAAALSASILLAEQPRQLDHMLSILLAVALILSNFLWCNWSHLPWWVFNAPTSQWELMPSFLLVEYAFLALFAVTLRHAVATDNLRLWFSSGICGTANDIFFHLLPFSDNFWQAQATIMLTPRLPVYIPTVYFSMLYVSTTAASRLGLPPIAEACATGLLAVLFYFPYDILGPKMLWWTWHDTDPAISVRSFGAPNGSTCWIVTYCSLHCFLLRLVAIAADSTKQRGSGDGGQVKASAGGLSLQWSSVQIVIVALICTPTFMLCMGVFQVVSCDVLGKPGIQSLGAAVLTYSAVVAPALRKSRWGKGEDLRRQSQSSSNNAVKSSQCGRNNVDQNSGGDGLLRRAMVLYFATFVLIAAVFDPSAHQSIGIHQTIGPCEEVSRM
jgi:hypothetical protein